MYQVLIIDDEPGFRATLQKLIDWEFLGLTLTGEFSDGAEALDSIANGRPDIIFCDIRMPRMNGIELLKQIPGIEHIKFVIISGYNDFSYAKEAIRHGAFDYLLKPVSQEDISGVILRAVDSLNEEKSQANRQFLSNAKLKKLVSGYESLFIHYAESKDIASIDSCIDEIFDQLPLDFPPQLYLNLFSEFMAIALKICENFKLESTAISGLYSDLNINQISRISQVSQNVKDIFQHLIQDLLNTVNYSEGKKIVEQALEYIDSNYTQKITLEIISKKYFINPYYFSQLFKSITHSTFSGYIIKKRIDEAKNLLCTSNLKVYQISEMVGYGDEKSFCRMFKKQVGMSPTEYALAHANILP